MKTSSPYYLFHLFLTEFLLTSKRWWQGKAQSLQNCWNGTLDLCKVFCLSYTIQLPLKLGAGMIIKVNTALTVEIIFQQLCHLLGENPKCCCWSQTSCFLSPFFSTFVTFEWHLHWFNAPHHPPYPSLPLLSFLMRIYYLFNISKFEQSPMCLAYLALTSLRSIGLVGPLWDDWMASLIQGTWVWENFRR